MTQIYVSHTKLQRDIFMNVTPRKKSCAYKNTPIPNPIDVTASAIKVLKGFYFFFIQKKSHSTHMRSNTFKITSIETKPPQIFTYRKLSRMQNRKREIRFRQSAGAFSIFPKGAAGRFAEGILPTVTVSHFANSQNKKITPATTNL